ncbi:MAG: glycosyltransferase family 4 protein [Actinobacteria bacterium]|nr:glycosyltransferase family 4 protein [Actinomycetota bacterium]
MHIAIVHGYFLGDSGSAIYTRELAHEFTRQGHEVTLVCQEQHSEAYQFIDHVYDLKGGNREPEAVIERSRLHEGSCRLVRPDIGRRLLTYVAGPFPPFEARPIQDAPDDWIETYIAANIEAMTAAFDLWPPDFVVANHAVLQPFLVQKALDGKAGIPYVVTIHGSELNFTVKHDPRMVPYMVEALGGAGAIATLSESSRDELLELAGRCGLEIEDRTTILPPGVDTRLFTTADDRDDALGTVSPAIDPLLDDVAVFAGRLLWTKGLQHVIAALPLILGKRSRFQLIVVGEGPMRAALEKLVMALGSGDIVKARELAASEPELRTVPEFGPLIPEFSESDELSYIEGARELGRRIHFTGHLSHEQLAPLFAAADISLAPSIFPEAFGLVSIEALAAGALPVATYQSGLRTPLDVVAGEFSEPVFRELAPGVELTRALAASVISILENNPTREMGFREKLHSIAERNFSWATVARGYIELCR